MKKDFTYARQAPRGFASRTSYQKVDLVLYIERMKNGIKIAVKQHKHASFQGEKEFKSEVTVLKKAGHENVCSPLNWKNRIKIALGIAKARRFWSCKNPTRRLGSFLETIVVRTLGYVARICESGKAYKRTDVYSLGGAFDHRRLMRFATSFAARPLLKEGTTRIDKRIVDSHDAHQLLWMVRVAKNVIDPHKQLPMENVVDALCYIMGGNTCYSIKGFSRTIDSLVIIRVPITR
ncbi:hypothetical protein AAG906_032435 [Vitis piasezkii]